MKNPSGQPSWRGADAPGPSNTSLGPRWRSQPEGSAPRQRSGWPLGRILLVFVAFATVYAAFVWVSLWLKPAKDTALIVLAATYQENLTVPHNVPGWNVGQSLAANARTLRSYVWGAGQLQFFREPREIMTPADVLGSVAGFRGKSLLIYASLHGGADRNGAYLLPGTAYLEKNSDGSLNPEKVRLEKVFDTLEEIASTLSRDHYVVLILDATQMAENWSLGMLSNEFARELDKLNARIEKVPNLIVISASGIDQRSWTSDGWRQTVFGHFLVEGLKGAADGAADGEDPDGLLNLFELFEYVKHNVAVWARDYRQAVQTPVLYPREDAGRDRARKLRVSLAAEFSPPDPQSWKVAAPPPALVDAWKRYVELLRQTPRPAVYTPHLWRLYQDWLLRYEQLVLVGGSSAANVQMRLRDLEQAMAQAQRRELASERNTLAMIAATGRLLDEGDVAVRAVKQLWETPRKDRAKLWQNILSKSEGVSVAHLRLQVMELLYQDAAEDPGTHLDRAYQLLTLVDDTLLEDQLNVRPAETHFLKMLRRDLPGLGDVPAVSLAPDRESPRRGMPVRLAGQDVIRNANISSDLLQLALRVRLRAERAALGLPDWNLKANLHGPETSYPYVEQVAPWIQPKVDQGDQLRRRGQDLLFAGDQASWDRGEKLLMEAHLQYQEAQENAVWVRRALGTRDTILPILPYLARWLVQRRQSQPEKHLNEPALQPEMFEKLCQQVHALLDVLAQPRPELAKDAADAADRVNRQFRDIETGAIQLRQNLDKDIPLPTVWHEVDAALMVPFTSVDLRLELLERKSNIGLHFQTKAGKSSGETPVEESVKDRARRRGRMNLAVLGQRWFDECGGDLESFEKVGRRLEVFAVEEKWWESLTIAGEEIGQRWQRLPAEIERLTDSAFKNNPQDAGVTLRRADRCLRFLESQPILAKNPADNLRLHNLGNLLLVQARRTWQDHWFADDPVKEPYYRRAGHKFLNDAESVVKSAGLAPDPRLADLAKKLNDPAGLRLDLVSAPGLSGKTQPEKLAKVNLTTEQAFAMQYRLSAPGKELFSGLPLLWVETGPGIKLDGEQKTGRLVQDFRDRPDVPLTFQFTSPFLREAESNPSDSSRPLESNLTLRGYFRGQVLSQSMPIGLYPLSRMRVNEHPLPLKASVAVRATKEVHQQFGQGNGGLVIVLDCSGSMGPAPNQQFTKTTKFNEATEALRYMLTKVPKGTQVSLWVFGQAVGEQRTVEKAEDTIQSIVAPTTWDPADANLLKDVMDRVSYPAIVPWNESPILRAMATARQDLQNVTGLKTMVVITDGMDNRLDKDAEVNPTKKDTHTFLRDNFPDVVVNVIGFRVANQEEEKASKQFQTVEELPLPGKFFLVQENRELAATLEKVLRQKLRFWVDREDNRPVPGFGEAGLDVGTDSANDQWLPGGLLPGAFKVRVHTTKRLQKSIALNRSDMLLVDLTQNKAPGGAAGTLDFERVIYSEADFPWKPAKERGNWRLAVLQNQLITPAAAAPRGDNGAPGLQMLATLEKKHDPLATTLQQIVPMKTWIEASPPADIRTPLHQRWHYQPGYPAPAWNIELPSWPIRATSKTPVKPTVRMWWSIEEPLAGAILEKGHDFSELRDLNEKTLRVGEDDVTVESVQVEDRMVETAPARRDQPGKLEVRPCLVVRLRHAPASPVWARVLGLNAAGSEHRFFDGVGKYTGIFWPVSRDQANLLLKKIELISLALFKREAEQRNFFIELDNLYEPQANDARPLSPFDLARGDVGDRRHLKGNEAPPLLPAPPAVLPLPKVVSPERFLPLPTEEPKRSPNVSPAQERRPEFLPAPDTKK